MGYLIRYNPEQNKRYPIKLRKRSSPKRIAVITMICLILLGLMRMIRSDSLKAWLMPGDGQITETAFNLMITDIKEGKGFGDAVTTFCLEILEHAKDKP